ncbi:hypothetical protein NDU88_002391 [Pleurodeles waltl]|uniref:Uncharacterized protein n=1 Tax=Pleurodeles waltl TaxID=8319 RepID=A0AAV7W0I8_PLEWA|nr:hypothetical protein NDU88_002391 [Pleurodeles waltl]
MDELGMDFSLMWQDLRGVLAGRVTKAENHISTEEGDLAFLKRQVSNLTSSMADLQEAVEDAHNWARCSNLQLVGLPGALDAPDLAVVLEGWFCTCVPTGRMSATFIIECAHCSLVPRPPERCYQGVRQAAGGPANPAGTQAGRQTDGPGESSPTDQRGWDGGTASSLVGGDSAGIPSEG